MSTKRPGSESVTRRAVIASGARLSLLGAFCATIGSTIIAACMDEGHTPDGGPGSGSGSGSGGGYGYGYGYGCGGTGYGYGYGYGCDDGDGYGYGGYGF